MWDITATTKQERARRIAQRRVEGFAQQFGEAHRNLARHAAFPLVLTPDLLYQIWANFVPEAPWTAVAHVLLSRLCRQVGYEMYEMDISDRNLLLRELKGEFGQERFDELGEFLLDYVAQRLTDDDADTRDLREAQEWTALAYTKPDEVARKLAQRLSERVQQEDVGEVLRLASLVETLAEPLIKEGFEPLLVYSRGVDSLARSNQDNNVFATLKLKKMLVSNTAKFTLPTSIFDASSLAFPKSILDTASLAFPKSIFDASSLAFPKSILDTTSLAFPKSVMDTASLAFPKSIFDTVSLAFPKSILDTASLAFPKSILSELKKQRDSIISTASHLQIKQELIHKLINLICYDSILIESVIESELNEKLSGETVTSYLIPDDNNQGTIDEVGEIKEISLNSESVKIYDNYFVISFSLKIECQIT
jgi:hypothetical protein